MAKTPNICFLTDGTDFVIVNAVYAFTIIAGLPRRPPHAEDMLPASAVIRTASDPPILFAFGASAGAPYHMIRQTCLPGMTICGVPELRFTNCRAARIALRRQSAGFEYRGGPERSVAGILDRHLRFPIQKEGSVP